MAVITPFMSGSITEEQYKDRKLRNKFQKDVTEFLRDHEISAEYTHMVMTLLQHLQETTKQERELIDWENIKRHAEVNETVNAKLEELRMLMKLTK